ncbi:L-arabinose isomerase [Acidimicrobiaceae bacterium USS-CC1]|uniref:L-arabinose isomerase n=1 Tax=Acidiferrimicrobium australe TaxID=2664430 RepID=A0ABW9QX97_9ACTN|nr:L-arabinose isomerase [Acidiferrimicrobium australe]
MTVTDERPTCWFLTGSQALYGEETLRQVEEQSRRIVAMLNDAGELPVDVQWRPVLTDADAIRRACLDATGSDGCVGVLAWMHTFSPAKSWIAGLDALRKPLLHLHTQVNRSLPWDSIDMDFMNLNQAAHGDREFGYLETRMGVRRKTVVGHAGDPAVRSRIGEWMRAALGAAAARSLRMARFGDNMRDVAVTDGDKVEAQIRLGVAVKAYGVNDLVAAVDAAGPDEVDALIGEYAERYDVAPELASGGDRHRSLRDAARIEAGLRAFLGAGGFEAFTTNFEDLGGLRQLPGISVQRLMHDGYGFGAEGDWKTSLLLRILKVMGEGLPGGTSFMEDYTYHLGPGQPKILGAHMLEVCPSIAAGRPSCEIHPLSIGGRDDPVRLVFDAAPGPAIVVGLLDLGDRLRLVCNDIEVVPPDEPLPRLPVARAVWEPAPSLAASAECWLTAGGPHHTVLSSAVSPEALADLAEIIGVELVRIDASTEPGRFRQELRWNDAYYRLFPAGAR